MFKKFPSSPLQSEPMNNSCATRFSSELITTLQQEIKREDSPREDSVQEEPETTIAQGVSIKGVLRFEKLLRIDGFFEGEIESSGTLIIGPTGVVISNLHLKEAFISGKVKGHITVMKQLSLRGRAEVEGDIKAPLLSIDEGVSLKGNLQIAFLEPATQTHDDEEHYCSDN